VDRGADRNRGDFSIWRDAYKNWTDLTILLRVVYSWAAVAGVLGLVYKFSGKEIVEFDARKLTVCKDIHGWERKKGIFDPRLQ
jgi:hypothetical protein